MVSAGAWRFVGSCFLVLGALRLCVGAPGRAGISGAVPLQNGEAVDGDVERRRRKKKAAGKPCHRGDFASWGGAGGAVVGARRGDGDAAVRVGGRAGRRGVALAR